MKPNKRIRRAIISATLYRLNESEHGLPPGGFVIVWRRKAVGWCAELERPRAYRPGVLAVAPDGKSVFEANGGNYDSGATQFTLINEGYSSLRQA